MEAQRIVDFLWKFGVEVEIDEAPDYVELMMDNHKCVEYNGEQFYIPEDMTYSEEDEEVYEYLVEHFLT